jgi:hypothetical protein
MLEVDEISVSEFGRPVGKFLWENVSMRIDPQHGPKFKKIVQCSGAWYLLVEVILATGRYQDPEA